MTFLDDAAPFKGVKGGKVTTFKDAKPAGSQMMFEPFNSRLGNNIAYFVSLLALFGVVYAFRRFAPDYSSFDFSSASGISYFEPENGFTSNWWYLAIPAMILIAIAAATVYPIVTALPLAAIALGLLLGGGVTIDWGVRGAVPEGTDAAVVSWLAENEGLAFADDKDDPATAVMRGGAHEFVSEDGTSVKAEFVEQGNNNYVLKREPDSDSGNRW